MDALVKIHNAKEINRQRIMYKTNSFQGWILDLLYWILGSGMMTQPQFGIEKISRDARWRIWRSVLDKATWKLFFWKRNRNWCKWFGQTTTNLPSASAAVILFLGSTVNIFLMRSLAGADMEGHGALCKSSLACKTASNIAFSVSNTIVYPHITIM